MEKLLPLLIVFVTMLMIIVISVILVRWARKSSRRAAFLGWGLQFLGAGVQSCASTAGSARRSQCPGKNQKGCGVGRTGGVILIRAQFCMNLIVDVRAMPDDPALERRRADSDGSTWIPRNFMASAIRR